MVTIRATDTGTVHTLDADGLPLCGALVVGFRGHHGSATCEYCRPMTTAPPVHGPGSPEQFGSAPTTETLLDREHRAVLRAERLQRAARDAAATLRLLPPDGTLHA